MVYTIRAIVSNKIIFLNLSSSLQIESVTTDLGDFIKLCKFGNSLCQSPINTIKSRPTRARNDCTTFPLAQRHANVYYITMQSAFSKLFGTMPSFNLNPNQDSTPAQSPTFDPASLGPRKQLYAWSAQSRSHYKNVNARLSRSILVTGVVLGLLLILMQEFVLIFFFVSLGFFLYVLTKSPPEQGNYEINTHGVICGDKQYYWPDLKNFFYIKADDLDVLVIETSRGIPTRLFLTVNGADQAKIRELLDEKLYFLSEAPRTFLDTIYDSVRGKLNV